MPGGRLRRSERRYIAEALDQGFGYAEIARRLHRPTSTISREIARNGGRDGYDAESAHRATADRARRSRVRRGGVSATDDPEELRAFRTRYVAMMIETGMPPMPARILVSLLTSPTGRLTSADLVRLLWVSPAAVSKAVGYLETLGMLRREREPGVRRETYVVDEKMWVRVWFRAMELQLRWARYAVEGAVLLGLETPSGARLADMAEVTERMNRTLSRELERYSAAFGERRDDRPTPRLWSRVPASCSTCRVPTPPRRLLLAVSSHGPGTG